MKDSQDIRIKNCSERITEILNENKLSLSELADLTGVHVSSIYCYKAGKYLPKSDKADLIAKAIGVSPLWIMGMPNANKYVVKEKSSSSENKQELLMLIEDLDENELKIAVKLIKALK